jgi:hypothetical protein
VREFGFGYFGLKVWGESVKTRVLADAAVVERVILRAEPPLSFARLAELLEVPPEGPLADQLWQTAASLRNVLLICSVGTESQGGSGGSVWLASRTLSSRKHGWLCSWTAVSGTAARGIVECRRGTVPIGALRLPALVTSRGSAPRRTRNSGRACDHPRSRHLGDPAQGFEDRPRSEERSHGYGMVAVKPPSPWPCAGGCRPPPRA